MSLSRRMIKRLELLPRLYSGRGRKVAMRFCADSVANRSGTKLPSCGDLVQQLSDFPEIFSKYGTVRIERHSKTNTLLQAMKRFVMSICAGKFLLTTAAEAAIACQGWSGSSNEVREVEGRREFADSKMALRN